MILITPDGERTMNTYLGACVEFGPSDVDEEVVALSAVTYMEGYLWDPEEAKKAFLKAAEIAHQNGRKVAITLSDSFCVDRYRSEFQATPVRQGCRYHVCQRTRTESALPDSRP